MRWEVVLDDPTRSIRRARVPGGWLYQVEIDQFTESESVGRVETAIRTFGWSAPVFVPEVIR